VQDLAVFERFVHVQGKIRRGEQDSRELFRGIGGDPFQIFTFFGETFQLFTGST
jgi:hypothetical protein